MKNILTYLAHYFYANSEKQKRDALYHLLQEMKSSEKKKMIRRVVRSANNEQRSIYYGSKTT